MKVIFQSSDGRQIELYSNPYRLYYFEGLADVEAETQLQKVPYRDGGIYFDTILQTKPITLEVKITGKTEEELLQLKRNLSSIFNPKLGMGKLTRIIGEDVKEINVVVDGSPFFPEGNTNRGRLFQKTLIHLIAPEPYWRDPQTVSRALRAYEGKFKLPTTFPIEFGISGDTTILWNEGDADAPVTIDIQGPVTNPQVINKTTGQYIRVNRSLSADEVLHIDTGRPRRVEIYRDGDTIENAMGYLDHNSDFWELIVGANEIQYIADAGNADAIVAVAWQNRYVGV